MPYPVINNEECTACGACVDACPNECLEIEESSVALVNEDNCIGCENCIEECPMGVITSIEED